MSPIQRDGIHAYILLPREFKRQRRSSRLKAIQSLFFLPSPPPNSFWAIKFKNSNVHYKHLSWTNENLPSLLPGGLFKWCKRVLEWCDRIKVFFDLSVCLCRSIRLWGHLTVQKTHGLYYSHFCTNSFSCSPFYCVAGMWMKSLR